MSHQSRNNVIKEFRDKEEMHVMIASLKCGGVGLNLTMANRVICIGKSSNLYPPLTMTD